MRWAHVLGTMLILHAGCANAGRAWTEADPWYHAIDDDVFEEWQDVEFAPVASSRVDEAIALVTEAPAVTIDTETAERLTEGAWDGDEPAVAVRAVVLNEATGGFSVQTRERKLWVRHASLGRRAVPMKRTVLVVSLAELPETVYVTCSMAQ
ncbi:hypothetical protein [Paraliomyxa miuraensis]|uniref:hypothetical protein n=1 Tax=Paraliomyxa miuraensis TaxID=376150 RepID=UPI002253FAE4|nr:hypothetical protein [Paraliomyxa miuraensis]MCX4244975.1 hypothetical protein [Paraliomyxa miuraensis]